MRRRRTGLITLLVVTALSLYALASLASTAGEIASREERRAELARQVSEMERGNARLAYETARSGDAAIEAAARDKLGLVYPGEILFYDIGD